MKFYVQEDDQYRLAKSQEIIAKARTEINRSYRRGKSIRSPKDSEDFLKLKLGGLTAEVFAALWLDNRHRIISFDELFQGSIDGTAVYPRIVVQRALELNAAAVVFAHPHPSGIAEPSIADENITKRLKSALDLIDVRLLDHIVVGETCVSLAARGLI